MTFVLHFSVLRFRDLGGQLSFSIWWTSSGMYHRRYFILILLAQTEPQSVRIFLDDLRLQNATKIPERSSYSDMRYLLDEFLQLLRESGALRFECLSCLDRECVNVNSLSLVKIRCDCVFESVKRSVGFGKLSAWQLLLSGLVEVCAASHR